MRQQHPDLTTLSQHFMNHGYAAARAGKIYHADNPDGIGSADHDDPESWQIARNPVGRDKTLEDRINRISDRREGVPHHETLGAQLSWYADDEGSDAEFTDGQVATEAIQLMQRYTECQTPFFLGVGFYRPHTPFVAPKAYFDWYQREEMPVPKVPEGYLSSLPKAATESIRSTCEWKPGQIDIPEALAQEVIQAYYAGASYVDACMGRVLDAIDEQGIADNTIVVFLSDHGFHLGEHGHWQKHSLFNQANQIPLMIAAPGMKGGQRSVAMVEMVDLYRTLCELTGLPEPVWTSGLSFAYALKEPNKSLRSSIVSSISINENRHYSLRTDEWRYTRWGPGGPGMTELYHLPTDPNEMDNLASGPTHRYTIQILEALLRARLSRMEQPPLAYRTDFT